MKHIFLKTIILSLSLLAVACKGEKQKGNFSTLDKPFVESYNNNRSDDTNTSKGKKNANQKNTFEVKQGLEIPIGKANIPSLILYREGYTTSYNAETRTPNWVAWHLTAAHTNGPIKRKGITFQADEEIPAPRVDTYDYMRSGYDRGHMCPAGDNHWSQKAMEQSFLMTNICPQEPALNSGLWNTVEKLCRTWAEQ